MLMVPPRAISVGLGNNAGSGAEDIFKIENLNWHNFHSLRGMGSQPSKTMTLRRLRTASDMQRVENEPVAFSDRRTFLETGTTGFLASASQLVLYSLQTIKHISMIHRLSKTLS